MRAGILQPLTDCVLGSTFADDCFMPHMRRSKLNREQVRSAISRPSSERVGASKQAFADVVPHRSVNGGVGPTPSLIQHVDINHCRRHIRMSQKLLHRPDAMFVMASTYIRVNAIIAACQQRFKMPLPGAYGRHSAAAAPVRRASTPPALSHYVASVTFAGNPSMCH
jgi:hypothetical protein